MRTGYRLRRRISRRTSISSSAEVYNRNSPGSARRSTMSSSRSRLVRSEMMRAPGSPAGFQRTLPRDHCRFTFLNQVLYPKPERKAA